MSHARQRRVSARVNVQHRRAFTQKYKPCMTLTIRHMHHHLMCSYDCSSRIEIFVIVYKYPMGIVFASISIHKSPFGTPEHHA